RRVASRSALVRTSTSTACTASLTAWPTACRTANSTAVATASFKLSESPSRMLSSLSICEARVLRTWPFVVVVMGRSSLNAFGFRAALAKTYQGSHVVVVGVKKAMRDSGLITGTQGGYGRHGLGEQSEGQAGAPGLATPKVEREAADNPTAERGTG